MLVTFVSAKHSPGATTTAMAFSVAARELGPTLFVEMDPAGGDAAALYHQFHLGYEPGLMSVSAIARRGEPPPESIWEHTLNLPIGVAGIVSPTYPETANSALQGMGGKLASALTKVDGWVFVDGGRWDARQPSADRVRAAHLVVALTRPTVEGVEHTNAMLNPLLAMNPNVTVMLVGEKPYSAREVAGVLAGDGVGVVGVLEDDARSAQAIRAGADYKALRRLPLVRSAFSLLEPLHYDVARRMTV